MSRLERLYAPPEIGPPGKRLARDRRRDLRRAGLFVLAMIAVSLAALTMLRPGALGGIYRVHVYFRDATGLMPGIPVLQDGYAIGLVDGVEPLFPGRDADAEYCPKTADAARAPLRPCFRAQLRIGRDWPIPADSRARIGSAGLLQGTAIKIEPGRSTERLAEGARLTSAGRERDLMVQLRMLTDTLQGLVDETIAPMLESVQQQVEAIEGLIGAGGDGQAANGERLAGVLESLQRLASRIESVVDAAQLGRILTSIEAVSANLREASAGVTAGTSEVQRAVRRYRELAEELDGLIEANRPELERSLDDTQYLLQELAAALAPILANIEDATRNLAALSRDLRENPAVILRGRQQEERSRWAD